MDNIKGAGGEQCVHCMAVVHLSEVHYQRFHCITGTHRDEHVPTATSSIPEAKRHKKNS